MTARFPQLRRLEREQLRPRARQRDSTVDVLIKREMDKWYPEDMVVRWLPMRWRHLHLRRAVHSK
jgi:hypothetical protein